MRKLGAVIFGIVSANMFSQNYIQVNNLNRALNNDVYVQRQNVQAVQTFASNVQLKRNTVRAVNKITPVKANPINTVKPATVKRRRPVVQNNVGRQMQTQPLVQVQNYNPPQSNPINQIEYINVSENNTGNSFGNENEMVQQAAAPAIEQKGHAGDFLEGISINLPKLNIKTVNLSKKSSSSKSYRKSFHVKNKFVKMNRKLRGKLSFNKRLRIKVDNCFKW